MDDQTVFSVPWFQLTARTVSGAEEPYYVLRTADYVTILATTPEGSILLVRQFRPALGREVLELPSGHVDKGEPPEAAARRELAEEAGYEAETFVLLGTLSPNSGRQDNTLWCYYAGDATPIRTAVDREPGVELVVCNLDDLIRHVSKGRFTHALDLSVLFLAVVNGRFSVGPIHQENEGR